MSSEIDEQLISQIVLNESGLDKALGNVLKTVWSAGRQNAFLKALESFAERKDAEIERICHSYYQPFVQSIEELFGLRACANKLRERVGSLNEELGTSGQRVYETKREIYEAQKMLLNIGRVLVALQDSLRALNTAQRATLEVIDRNFADALRLIEDLQSNQLRLIDDFSFSRKLYNWIPSELNKIKQFAISEMKTWLGCVREQSAAIGKIAMNKSQHRLEYAHKTLEEIKSLEDSAPLVAAHLELVMMEQDDAVNVLENERVDFEPLLKALHLFDLMDRRKEFQVVFAENRRLQADIILAMPVKLDDPESRSLQQFLEQTCGFFILEYFITQLPLKFYPPSNVEVLWEMAVGRINSIVLESLGVCSDQATFMKIKWAQVFFMHAIEIYNFSVSALTETLISLFYRYVELLKTDHSAQISQAVLGDSLKPLDAKSASAMQRMRRNFAFLSNSDFDSITVFPFTASIVDSFNSIVQFVNFFYVFLEGVPQQTSELDEIAKKAQCLSVRVLMPADS